MHTLEIGGTAIAYTDQGQGDAVVLVHGFAASVAENWQRSGWLSMLERAKRRVVALDLRGHGRSVKFYEPDAYSFAAFADDVVALVEHLQLKKPDLIGFSLGARVVLQCLLQRPEKFLLGVLCGVGELMLRPSEGRDAEVLAKAMEALDADGVSDDMARRFRLFAEGQGQDLKALAAVSRGLIAHARLWTAAELGTIKHEMLVVAGTGDDLAGDPEPLARALANAKAVRVPGCGHMDCLIQPMFKGTVMDFLCGMP
jgi:pimeloyl-ACP methyl ester carboxylesterase